MTSAIRVKVPENLGATAVAPVAPADTSLTEICVLGVVKIGSTNLVTFHHNPYKLNEKFSTGQKNIGHNFRITN